MEKYKYKLEFYFIKTVLLLESTFDELQTEFFASVMNSKE